MTLLQSIAAIVTKYGHKRADIINFDRTRKGAENADKKAFKLVLKGTSPDDKNLEVYPGYEKGSAVFRQFASRFRKKMLNMLLLQDVSNTRMSATVKAEFECIRTGLQARLLTGLYERDAGINLAGKLCDTAEEFGLPAPMLTGLMMLRKQASETGNIEELKSLIDKTVYWQERQAAESKAMGYYELIDVHFAVSISQKPWLADVAFKNAKIVEEDLKRFDSPIIIYEWHRLRHAGHYCANQYKEAVMVMEELEAWLDNHKNFDSDTIRGIVAVSKLDCYIPMKDYTAGMECVEAGLKNFWKGSRNSLFFMELYFVFAMQTGEYAKAGNIIVDAQKEPGYKDLDKVHKEKWRLYKAFFTYAIDTWDGKKPFSSHRFLQDYINLTNDKSGHNAAIYIIAWCLQLRYGNPVELTGKAEAFKKYRDRHLKELQDHRINIFMNMMQTADRLDYNYEKVRKATAEFLAELKATPTAEHTGNPEGVEIIPLETLWEMVMKDMKSRSNS